jgi:hypothetical protein
MALNRKRVKLSQKGLAVILGVARVKVAAMENDRESIPPAAVLVVELMAGATSGRLRRMFPALKRVVRLLTVGTNGGDQMTKGRR